MRAPPIDSSCSANAAALAAIQGCRSDELFEVQVLSLEDLGPRELAAWDALERRALEPNPNLSPCFVLPMIRHLDDNREVRLQVLRRSAQHGGDWIAVVPLRAESANRFMPLPHWRVELSKHAFLSGLLIDRAVARAALHRLMQDWQKRCPHAIVLEACRIDGPLSVALRQVAIERGLWLAEVDSFDRAAMVPAQMGAVDLQVRLPTRAKKRRSQLKKLSALGEVRFSWWMGQEIDDAVIERFLALENMGWKGENGSSLLSRPSEAAFFREMVRRFSVQDRAWFVELSLGGRVIASSSNLCSDRAAAAFKIGYDPEFAAQSPGINCELELMVSAPDRLAHIEWIDSGTVAGSYVEELWPHRQRVGTLILATSAVGQVALAATQGARSLKRLWRHVRAREGQTPPKPA